MATDRRSTDVGTRAHEAALHGVLALLVEDRESRIANDKNATKTELLLERVGLTVEEIANVMGKNRDAVRKAISRGRAA
jgi:DNA-directed RNA polymerase specialized sigma24 family protein